MINQTILNTDVINRIEVIDETGRVLVRTNVTIKISEQDNGQTIKVFVTKQTEEGK